MASIVKTPDGYRSYVYVRGMRATKTFRTQREARAWSSAREIELSRASEMHESDLHTVGEMCDRYALEISSKKRGERSEILRIAAFKREFPEMAALKLSDFDTPHLAHWRDARLQKVSVASVHRDINLLRNIFLVALKEWKWIKKNPFEGLKLPPKAAARTRRTSPWTEVKPILRWLGYRSGAAPKTKYQEVALAYMVALRSAMRAGEILSLGKGTLDLRRGVATVHHKTEYLTGRPRAVPLTRHAIRLLSVVAHREKCFTISSASLDALFRKAKKALLINDLHFHDARAEALTRLSRNIDVMTLAKISGHKDLKLLQEVYYRETAEDISTRLRRI